MATFTEQEILASTVLTAIYTSASGNWKAVVNDENNMSYVVEFSGNANLSEAEILNSVFTALGSVEVQSPQPLPTITKMNISAAPVKPQ